MWSEEAEEVVGGEIIGDGDDKKESGAGGNGGRVRDGGVAREGAEEMDNTVSLDELRVCGGGSGGGGGRREKKRVVGIHRVDPDGEHVFPLSSESI